MTAYPILFLSATSPMPRESFLDQVNWRLVPVSSHVLNYRRFCPGLFSKLKFIGKFITIYQTYIDFLTAWCINSNLYDLFLLSLEIIIFPPYTIWISFSLHFFSHFSFQVKGF